MTTISEVNAPVVDPADRRVPTGRSRLPMSMIIAVPTLIVTCVNVFALIYLSSVIRDLHAIDKKLELLQAFEDRIASRIDTMNIGFQNRLETLGGEVHGQFNQIDAKLGRIESHAGAKPANSDQVEARFTEMAEHPADDQVGDADSAERFLNGPELDSLAPVARPKKPATKSLPSPNLAYERVQSADGKVYYRKMD